VAHWSSVAQVSELSITDASTLVKGPAGKTVRLTLQRYVQDTEEQQKFSVSLLRLPSSETGYQPPVSTSITT